MYEWCFGLGEAPYASFGFQAFRSPGLSYLFSPQVTAPIQGCRWAQCSTEWSRRATGWTDPSLLLQRCRFLCVWVICVGFCACECQPVCDDMLWSCDKSHTWGNKHSFIAFWTDTQRNTWKATDLKPKQLTSSDTVSQRVKMPVVVSCESILQNHKTTLSSPGWKPTVCYIRIWLNNKCHKSLLSGRKLPKLFLLLLF